MTEAARRSMISDVPESFSLPWPQKMQIFWRATIGNPNHFNIRNLPTRVLIYLKHIQKVPNDFILCSDIFLETLPSAGFSLFQDELHSTKIFHFKIDYV